ncbi:MAG: LacI family DNA-binding transcriptional regulator [Algoriphagus sp.]
MKKGRQVTMKEIAKKLGVSVSTVSRALQDSPELHPETKRKITEAAKEMNYRPNLLAQSLRISRSKTLGVIVPEITSHFFASCISGIQDTAITRGYNVMICQSNESITQEKANIQTLVSSQVDGLLISLSRETNTFEHLHELYDREINFVLFDRVEEDIPVSKVTFNDAGGAYQVVKHLLENGFRRIAYVSGPEDLYISKKRKEGYLRALQEYGVEIDEQLIQFTDLTLDGNLQVAQRILQMQPRPEAVFCMIDPVAVDVLTEWKKSGIWIPEDIALAGFTDNPTAAVVEPPLTTVSQPGYEMGKLAVSHLLDQLDGLASEDPVSIVLDTTLVIRKSSQHLPAKN